MSRAVVLQGLLVPVSGSQTPIWMCCSGGNLEREPYTMEEKEKLMRTEKRQRTALELTTSHALAAMPSRNTGKQCPHLIGCTGALELMKTSFWQMWILRAAVNSTIDFIY